MWGIKLIRNFLTVIKSLSKRRALFLVLLVTLYTVITVYLFSGLIDYMIFNSVTLSALHSSLISIVGYAKYQAITGFIQTFSKLFIFLIFFLYGYLFYRREIKKQYTENMAHIMNEVSLIASGNFDHRINAKYHNNLDTLAKDINNIVLKLKEAIEEERKIENTKNELITNVSHDLRTPLTSTIGYLGLIEQDKYRDEIELRHYTGIAYKKALNLENLINELFEYTRMQDKRIILNKESIDIAEILAQLITENRWHFIQNNLTCREHIPTHPISVIGDGEKLARVFNNLIMNAIHYGKKGTFIDIEAKVEDNWVVVSVSNFGEQIPSIDLPHIFERFYRAEKSRSTNTGGSGLGLAIAKSIVEHHDGIIEANSTSEKTNFTVRLKQKVDNA